MPEDPEERKRKAQVITNTRILTQADFKKIQMRQLSKQMSTQKANKDSKGKKRKSVEMATEDEPKKQYVYCHILSVGILHIKVY